jgi:hypothetical protein
MYLSARRVISRSVGKLDVELITPPPRAGTQWGPRNGAIRQRDAENSTSAKISQDKGSPRAFFSDCALHYLLFTLVSI